jgi:hypothetical protein
LAWYVAPGNGPRATTHRWILRKPNRIAIPVTSIAARSALFRHRFVIKRVSVNVAYRLIEFGDNRKAF